MGVVVIQSDKLKLLKVVDWLCLIGKQKMTILDLPIT